MQPSFTLSRPIQPASPLTKQVTSIMHRSTETQPSDPTFAGWRDYIRIARFDHAAKHVFIIPGFVLGGMLRGVRVENLFLSAVLGLLTAVAIASANYVINEYLDREFDRHHPTKSLRTAVQRKMKAGVIALEWLALIVVGLGAARIHSQLLFYIGVVFAMQGLFYNVAPLRMKDRAYLDVVVESINNPLRLAIGWAVADPTTLPPGSLILAYWLGGAFLMGAKRLSEYREVVGTHGIELLTRYRASFRRYTEISLLAACLFYALLAIAFMAIFLIKYRIEYILLLPFIVALFVSYFWMAYQPGSTAQKPERLFLERELMMVAAAVVVVFIVTSYVSMPWLDSLASQHFISVR